MLRDSAFGVVHHYFGDGVIGRVVTPPILPQDGYETSPWHGTYLLDGVLCERWHEEVPA